MPVQPVPEGYEGVSPYLLLTDAAAAISFYEKALGAKEMRRFPGPGGKVGHAELRVGSSVVMLADVQPGSGFGSPKALGGTSVGLHIYVPDVDSAVAQAVAAGARVLRPLADQFYGDRSCTISDPFGHVWTLSTHKEDLSPEEIGRRAAALGKGPA